MAFGSGFSNSKFGKKLGPKPFDPEGETSKDASNVLSAYGNPINDPDTELRRAAVDALRGVYGGQGSAKAAINPEPDLSLSTLLKKKSKFLSPRDLQALFSKQGGAL